jgi:alkylated DNA repair dioxygenase AlkB
MQIPNLTYLPNFISEKKENELVQIIDTQSWLDDLKRRVQHYGYKYDYKARRIDTSMKIGSLPDWLGNIGKNLQNQGFFKQKPDQVIVNEYFAGQGIAAHIDCEPCFEDTIVSLSLLAPVYMDFTKENEKIPLWLEPRSIVVLQGESRYEWKHSIAARKSDTYNGLKINRERRISLTFRKVIL